MGARRWGGVNSLLGNQVPLRPWSQMASEVSAGPLGRIAPSAWTVWLGLAGSTVVLRFSGLPGWGGFPSVIGLRRFVPSFDEVGFVGTQRFSSALGGRFRSRGGSRRSSACPASECSFSKAFRRTPSSKFTCRQGSRRWRPGISARALRDFRPCEE